MKGHTYKRCPCGTLRDDDGRRVNCAKKHGSWCYVHPLPPDAHGKRRQATKGGFASEREARQALNQALAAVTQSGYVEPTRLTVGEYLDQWIAGKAGLRSNTRRSYQGHIDLYLKPGLGHVRLTELRDVHIERLYAVLPLVGRSCRTTTCRTSSPASSPCAPARVPSVRWGRRASDVCTPP